MSDSVDMSATDTTKVTAKSFALLEGLAADNSKEWFDTHRKDVRGRLLEPFAAALLATSARLVGTDVPLHGSEATMFRMNRDVRFSKDKRPYKESVSGLLTPSGTKKEDSGLVYVELDVDGGWCGGGFYKLPTKALNAIRDRMVERPDEWEAARRTIAERGGELMRTDALKRMPRGYEDHAESALADDLRLKSLIVRADLPKSAWLDGTAPERIARTALACAPLIAFGNAARE